MTETSDQPSELVSGPGPNELRDPEIRREFKRAAVWLGMVAGMALVVLLIQPLLIIFGGLVFAALLDGGVRLIRRVLPIPRGLALALVVLLAIGFLGGVVYLTGVQVAQQFGELRATLEVQTERVMALAARYGFMPGPADFHSLANQVLGSFGRLTSWLGSAAGAVGSFFMILIIGLFVAIEPRIYERGLQWMVPQGARRDFAVTIERMASTMRVLLAGRLLGMVFEGIFTWLVLMAGGVPMALLLGILAGILAFIPNLGAILTGVLMTAVGFSAGVDTGLWALGTYFFVQTFDGWVVIPLVARRTVDMPPALTLSSQILASTLFGILGLALADPLVAMIKVALERESEMAARDEAAMGEAA
ncbi:AI-2E family transporter [Sphingomonas sp.]|uniref:AI-2E family transporter n=1 Tax=Sphingomonas sp. TaxID=28214 RepID=UPI001DB8A31C|nr:AI-2E family transporter [Sphingomonas sp.]MBX9797755.1 AI-2E family transporter [Sphingomonas sp.]